MTDPYTRLYENVIPEELCDRMITLLDKSETLKLVGIHDADYRRCLQLPFPNASLTESTAIYEETLKVIRNVFERYKAESKNLNLNFCERIEKPSILKYRTNGKDLFHLHADNWNTQSSTRQVSLILYLNDVESGGKTTFPGLNLSIQPKKGSILLFPSFFTHQHYAEQPISNSKYVAVTWLCLAGQGNFYETFPF